MKDVSPGSKEIVMAFNEARDLEGGWRAWSDAEHGGKSRASLTWTPRPEGAEDGDEGAMVLEGEFSVRNLSCIQPHERSGVQVGTFSFDECFPLRSTPHISQPPPQATDSPAVSRGFITLRVYFERIHSSELV